MPADRSGFPAEGTHLARYAEVFDAVEVNSSFYRPHRRATYARWAAEVPLDFRFSVKVPKAITHELRLARCAKALDEFLGPVQGLGEKLGCLLVQLPPKLEFEAAAAGRFLRLLRARHVRAVVIEPRHPSWFEPRAHELLETHRIARAAADPPRSAADGTPGGWGGLAYHRLHGSPRMYFSAYQRGFLDSLAARLGRDAAACGEAWCIFDNTGARAAVPDALYLQGKLTRPRAGPRARHRKEEQR